MAEPVIKVRGVGKRYRIGGARKRYKTMRESVANALIAPFRRNGAASSENAFWALKNVDFEIEPGEVVGIIGRNGAGKSTLLKVLSRITDPTEGEIEISGRVGSLLEVGTGFHPELTGRENIYLNGAILGMTRREISKKFDEIVDFAETEKFLDTPVKFYSSGMYTRLAFAVAAHLEPEILVVDEVLAVGDAEFQKKCMGKMSDVAQQGRTVLFVSHNMNAIEALCGRCILLSAGTVAMTGTPNEVVPKYLAGHATSTEWIPENNQYANPYFKPLRFAVVDANLKPLGAPQRNDAKVGVLIEGAVETLNSALAVGFAVTTGNGDLLYWSLHTDPAPDQWPPIRIGENRLIAWLPPRLLNEGDYQIELHVSLHFQQWLVQPGVHAPGLTLSIRGGLSDSPHWIASRPGLIAPVVPFKPLDVDSSRFSV